MTLPRQRITVITLGVADLARAKDFYARWGWTPHPGPAEGIAFYQMHGAALALFALNELAADQGRPAAQLATGAVTLAQNCADKTETDAVFDAGIAAGGTVLRRPRDVFWGGYSGHLTDPDDHVWEIAWNPMWPLDKGGALTLP